MSRFKMAQRRSMLDKFKQNFDVGTKSLSLFDRQFREFFQKLQEFDEIARQEGAKLAPLKKGAENHFENKNYIGCAEQLGRFYDSLKKINDSFDKIVNDLAEQNYSVLVDHLDDDVKKYIHEQIQSNAGRRQPALTSRAGLFDWLKDSIYTRRRAINALEKKFSRFKELRTGLGREIVQADKVFVDVIKIFKVMSGAIAKGDINAYERNIELFKKVFTANNTRYRSFFVTHIKPFGEYLAKHLALNSTVAPTDPTGKALDTKLPASGFAGLPNYAPSGPSPALVPTPQIHSLPSQPSAPVAQRAPVTLEAPDPIPFKLRQIEDSVLKSTGPASTAPASQLFQGPPATINSGPKHNPAAKAKKPAPRLKNPPPIDMTDEALEADDQYFDAYASNHDEFLTKLATMEDKSLKALANEILEYSESLEDTDPEASLRLLAIVEGIL